MAAEHQHYVPQMLLRGFLSRNPENAAKEQVHVFDLESGKRFEPSISNIMGERRYNDFWLDEETLATIEPAAGRIESHVAPLVERVRQERRLERSPEEFSDLALLMAFQFIRTKKIRHLPERLNEQLIAHIQKMGLDPTNVEGLEDWTEEKLKKQHAKMQIDGLPKYVEIIAEKEFFLMTAPEGSSFYLGDHPVVMHNDDQRDGFLRGGLGLAVPYIQIYLPLSAEVMLCAYDRAVLGQLMKSRDELMREFQLEALGWLRQGLIIGQEMKALLDSVKCKDAVDPLIESIRAGTPISIGPDQVQSYNSLQAFHAHRFVVDPDGEFAVASEMIDERKRVEAR